MNSDEEANKRAHDAELECDRLGLIPETVFNAIAGYTGGTSNTKRRRGEAPPFVRIGNHIYYWRDGVKKFFDSRTRHPRTVSAKDLL